MPKYIVFISCLTVFLMPCYGAAKGIDIVADSMVRDEYGMVTAVGDVEIKRHGETLKSDKIYYDLKHQRIEAMGHVDILSPQAHIQAESAILHTDDKTGELKQVILTLERGERLQADSLTRLSDMRFNADNISFTTCPLDAEAWRLYADHVEIDQHEGALIATGARFDIAGVPVFYSPYWKHSLRRKSGILLPDIGTSSSRGTEYALPYYWAAKSNWDATITPRWMTARGLMGEVELRHAAGYGGEEVQWAGLRDKQTQAYRQHIQSKVVRKFSKNWQFYANIDHVSDRDFLLDFALNDIGNSTRYLSSDVGLAWQGERGDVHLNTLYQQDLIQLNDDRTLQILPRLESRYAIPIMGDAQLHIDQQSTRFDRNIGVDGWRVEIHPWLALPLSMQGGAIQSTIQMGVHQTRYGQLNTGLTSTQKYARTVYDASLETRVSVERISADKHWRHSISPIFRYDLSYAPNQTGKVNFDTGFSQLTLNNLLQGNRFTGLDRFERMNRISVMLENSLQHKAESSDASFNIFTARLGVAYDLLRQNIDTTLQTTQLRPFSNLVGELVVSPMPGLTADASGQYDPVNKFWGTAQAAIHLQHQQGHQLNVRWQRVDARYSTATEFLSGDLDVAITPRWKAFGTVQYDARIKLTQQASTGIHYQHSCWDFKVEAYRNLNGGSTGAANVGYRFLLGFKGLGSVGG
ncbi:MAG: LPS assembly protein LptD [Mariprofundaceae bacterium]|nr:LPS assembly protein LptD [Mariprofundaceae bacterium]